ncbi:MAG: hypothetical protein K0S53_1235 [Bacteroidetes bacterium]|jgi:hypothetical protein|nr:hypothetical protein [Bacteroidota bacterium]MDF2452299.1 hypothetical protein [Bacteroidota bacterium]
MNGTIKIANQVFQYLGKLTIDYSSVTDVREVMEWHEKWQTITESVAERYKGK